MGLWLVLGLSEAKVLQVLLLAITRQITVKLRHIDRHFAIDEPLLPTSLFACCPTPLLAMISACVNVI